MKFKLLKIDKDAWKDLSESAYLTVFKEFYNKDLDRIDYALLAVNEFDEPIGYVTCRETDAKTIYWQFGGAFPPVKDTIYTFKVYNQFVEWHRDKYDRIHTLIKNDNVVMLKMAGKIGFLITGIKNFQGKILLEHTLELRPNGN